MAGHTPRTVVHRHSYSPSRTSNEIYEDDLRQLAASIILRAVDDWIKLIQKEAKPPRPPKLNKDGRPRRPSVHKGEVPISYDEIRDFLNSEYGSSICEIIQLDSDLILGRMEHWLVLYRTKGVVPPSLDKHPLSGRKRYED